ncbi:DAN domain family member 5 [Polymixia lowei]
MDTCHGALTFPRNSVENFLKGSRVDFESSGGGPDEPLRGVVKVVRLDPRLPAPSGLLRRGLVPRGAPSLGSRMPFPAFLSRGRPGPAPAPKAPAGPLHHLRPDSPAGLDMRKRQGLQMWQRAMNKGDHGKRTMSLPINLKDAAKQTCTAVPFTQRVTAEGCETVTVHNKLCFGQCSSLFVPSAGEFASASASAAGGPPPGHRRGPCSRCAPSRARTVTLPLRCGTQVREKRLLVVEECKCETGREEEERAEAAAAAGRLRLLS